jgi:glucokinase
MIVGADIGGSGLRVGLVGDDGSVSRLRREAHGSDLSADAVVAHLVAMIREVTDARAPDAVGIGVAAWVSRRDGIVVSAPNLPWRDVPLAERTRDALGGTRVVVANDLKAIAWGESRHGAGVGARTLLVIYVGTGVGSAVIDDARLLLGAEGFAGELGHIRVGPDDGPACGCGSRGCLEAYVGARAFANASGGLTTSELEARANAGDPSAQRILDGAGDRLGNAAAAAVMLANPDVLAWGGGAWESSQRLRDRSHAAFGSALHPDRVRTLRVREAMLGGAAGIIGAADLARANRNG